VSDSPAHDVGRPDFSVRPLESDADFEACTALQEAIWGEGFSERVPLAILRVATRLGGVASGAFDGQGRMIGFVFGLTGVEAGRLVHWSDMLGILPEARDQGVGTALKWHQRELLLTQGVRRMYWTFDPLESRNGRVNLGHLGAVVREYSEDMYGRSESPLHAGIGTDRLVATWDMESPRVVHRLLGMEVSPRLQELQGVPDAFEVDLSGEWPVPGPVNEIDAEALLLLVPVPSSIQELKAHSLPLAVRWREATRGALSPRLSSGQWEVTELLPGERVSHYLLERIPDALPPSDRAPFLPSFDDPA